MDNGRVYREFFQADQPMQSRSYSWSGNSTKSLLLTENTKS
jgi:hypothetical protein